MCADAVVCVQTLDRNGLRPCRYYVSKQGQCIISSEVLDPAAARLRTLTCCIQVGVLHNIKHEDMIRKGRVEPGRMFLIDFAAG